MPSMAGKLASAWNHVKVGAQWIVGRVKRMASNDHTDMGFTGNTIALGLLILFGCGVIWTLSRTLAPPLLADEAPPIPICVTTQAPAATGKTTPGAATKSPSGNKTSKGKESTQNRKVNTKQAKSRPATTTTPSMTRIYCPGGKLEYPSQARGAYDPNQRFIGLLAIVGPLITTVVGFFFGAKAGASGGRAQASQARAKTDSVTAAAIAAGTPDILAKAREIAPQAWDK